MSNFWGANDPRSVQNFMVEPLGGSPAVEQEAPQGFVQGIMAFFKKPQTQQAIQSAVQTYGPQVVEVASQMVESRGKGLDKLLKQLQKKVNAYSKAKNPTKRAKLAAQIQTLRAQIGEIQRAQGAGEAALSGQLPQSTVIAAGSTPVWLPVLLVGGALLLGAGVLAFSGGGSARRTNPRRKTRIVKAWPRSNPRRRRRRGRR